MEYSYWSIRGGGISLFFIAPYDAKHEYILSFPSIRNFYMNREAEIYSRDISISHYVGCRRSVDFRHRRQNHEINEYLYSYCWLAEIACRAAPRRVTLARCLASPGARKAQPIHSQPFHAQDARTLREFLPNYLLKHMKKVVYLFLRVSVLGMRARYHPTPCPGARQAQPYATTTEDLWGY